LDWVSSDDTASMYFRFCRSRNRYRHKLKNSVKMHPSSRRLLRRTNMTQRLWQLADRFQLSAFQFFSVSAFS
jgi:L-amino acid N-acyltransferase YncA